MNEIFSTQLITTLLQLHDTTFTPRYTTSMFTSEVHKEASYRRQADENSGNMARRFAGVPLTLFYGVSLYFLLRGVFFDARSTGYTANKNTTTKKSDRFSVISAVKVEWGELRLDIVGVCVAYSFFIAVSSILSRTFRCMLLLLFPCLVTGRNRIALLLFIIGMLFDRPIFNMARNVNILFEETWGMKPVPEMVSENLYIVGVVLMMVSFLFLMVEAKTYMTSYYSDNSFDNETITANNKRIWTTKQHPAVLPLRRWEMNKGYAISMSRCNKFDASCFMRDMLTILCFIAISVFILCVDFQLKCLLNKRSLIIKEEQPPLRQQQQQTIEISITNYIMIASFLALALLSRMAEHTICVGMCARMCDTVYRERVLERADYLYFWISTGRVQRRTQLTLTILNNIEKKRRSGKMVAPLVKIKRCVVNKSWDKGAFPNKFQWTGDKYKSAKYGNMLYCFVKWTAPPFNLVFESVVVAGFSLNLRRFLESPLFMWK